MACFSCSVVRMMMMLMMTDTDNNNVDSNDDDCNRKSHSDYVTGVDVSSAVMFCKQNNCRESNSKIC